MHKLLYLLVPYWHSTPLSVMGPAMPQSKKYNSHFFALHSGHIFIYLSNARPRKRDGLILPCPPSFPPSSFFFPARTTRMSISSWSEHIQTLKSCLTFQLNEMLQHTSYALDLTNLLQSWMKAKKWRQGQKPAIIQDRFLMDQYDWQDEVHISTTYSPASTTTV